MNELSLCIFRTFYQRCLLEEENAKDFSCEVSMRNMVIKLSLTREQNTQNQIDGRHLKRLKIAMCHLQKKFYIENVLLWHSIQYFDKDSAFEVILKLIRIHFPISFLN